MDLDELEEKIADLVEAAVLDGMDHPAILGVLYHAAIQFSMACMNHTQTNEVLKRRYG